MLWQFLDIIKIILDGTKPGLTDKGEPSKGKVIVDAKAKAEAVSAVNKLLGKFVLYPELDLAFLKKHFVK